MNKLETLSIENSNFEKINQSNMTINKILKSQNSIENFKKLGEINNNSLNRSKSDLMNSSVIEDTDGIFKLEIKKF